MRNWLIIILQGISTFFQTTIPAMLGAIITGLWTFFTLSTVITALPGYLPSANRLISKGWPTWAFVGAPYGWLAAELSSFMRAFGTEFDIYTRRVVRAINRDIPENRLSPSQLVAASVQSVLPDATVKDLLLDEGYTNDVAQNLIDIAGQPIAPDQALTLYNRFRAGLAKAGRTYDLAWVKQALAESALKNKYQDAVSDLADQFLGASDYVRFAVRDAFDDNVAARDRTDEDYPAVLGPLLRALGYRDEDAKAAWRAHWELPSPSQAYEMLWRGLITEAELQDYLRQADYAPRWRPMLQSISYNPITRTDAKRAFKLGLGGFDEARLKQAYMDLGYKSTDADTLVAFTKLDVGEEARQERELLVGPIRTQALNMYRARRITEDELRQVLANLKYPTEIVDRYVADIRFARDADHRDEVAAAVKGAFTKALRSRDDTRAILLANSLLLLPALAIILAAETSPNPSLPAAVDQATTADHDGGSLEGKEVRIGSGASALFAAATTATSTGAVDASHDSLSPLGGLVTLWLMQLGEVVFEIGRAHV